MKKPEEYVEEIKQEADHYADQDFSEFDIIRIITEAQKEAYNEAYNEAIEDAKNLLQQTSGQFISDLKKPIIKVLKMLS